MLHEIQYSIIDCLKSEVPELNKVIWETGEIEVSEADLPFVTVEYLTDINEQEKTFTVVSSRYYFQIGIRARSASELARLQEKVKRILIQEKIPLYDTTQSYPPPIMGELEVRVTNINNFKPEQVNDVTGKHRSYIDATVFFISKL